MPNKNMLPRPGKSQNPMKENRSNSSSPMRTRPSVMTVRAKARKG